MNEQVLSTRFESYAKWIAASHGYGFGDGAANEIASVAAKAAREIMQLPGVAGDLSVEQKARITQAEGAIALFVATMILGSRQIRGYADSNPDLIGEQTFQFAIGQLCPIWPFC